MRRLAAELDTGPASLYVYFRNTAELHAAVLDDLLGLVGLEPGDQQARWAESIVDVLWSYTGILFEHPGLARSALVTRPSGPNYLALVERLLKLLRQGGIPDASSAWGVDVLLLFATSIALEHGSRRQVMGADEDREALAQAIRHATPSMYPTIAELGSAIVSGAPRRPLRVARSRDAHRHGNHARAAVRPSARPKGFVMAQTAAFDVLPPTEPAPEGGDDDPTRLTPYLRAILAVVLIADILDLMDSTITNIAAPSIARQLGGGASLIKWLGAGYALAMGVLLVIGGRLGDRYGKRRIFLIGISGFTAASALCGLSIDPAMIIVGRLIQGGFGALMIPQGISILMATFSRAQLPRAFSVFGPAMGVSAVLGPIVAGFVISANIAGLDWRPVFLINIVLGLVGLIAATKLLPHDQPTSHDAIDAVGATLARRHHACA